MNNLANKTSILLWIQSFFFLGIFLNKYKNLEKNAMIRWQYYSMVSIFLIVKGHGKSMESILWSALEEKWQKRAKQVENNKVRIDGKRFNWKYNPKKLNIPSVDCFHRKLSELILRIDWLWEHCKRNGNWFICSIQIRRLKLKCTSDFDDSIETISLTVDARKQKTCDWITNSTEAKKCKKSTNQDALDF